MQRIPLFIIALIIVSISVVCIGVFYGGIATQYSVTNTQNISGYNQLTGINNMTSNLNNKVQSLPTSTGGFNVLGDFLSYGYNTFILTITSFDFFTNMLGFAFATIPTGDGGNGSTIILIQGALLSIVLVIFVFAIIELLSGRTQI